MFTMWGVDVRAWSHMCREGEMGHPAWRGSIGLHSKVQGDLTTRAETCGGQRGRGGQFAWVTMARAQGQEGPVGDCTISLHNLLWVTVVWRKVECATLLKNAVHAARHSVPKTINAAKERRCERGLNGFGLHA